ncbi:MAG TPA: ATP-binding protein, partial [Nitrospirota bacterium]
AFLSSSLSERLRATRAALEEKSLGLQELQALNDNIVRSMADGMVTVGMDGRITAFNNAAEEITGLGYRDVRGRSFSEIFDWVGAETFLEEPAGQPKKSQHHELVFSRPDKDLVIGMKVTQLVGEDGEISGMLGIFQDLTPMKEMEAEIKKKDRLAAIGELSAGMAHEIRNPLAALSGSLQVLKGNLKLTDEDGHLMNIALEEMDRLNGIVSEFLTYARPVEPVKEGCDFAAIVHDTVRLVRNTRDIGQSVSIETLLPGHPLPLEADPGQLKQVLFNLILNAVQSITDSGSVKVRAEEYGRDHIMLEVADDGEGIPAEDLDKIFYPFYSTKGGGAGLGLAIVYRIIEDHGGNVKVKSEPGRGSRFTVLLPIQAQD